MVAMNSSSKQSDLVKKVKTDYSQFKFKPGKEAHWSPATSTIIFNPAAASTEQTYGLLHELAHALLKHKDYRSDFELLKLEAEAWQLAAKLGKSYGIGISEDYIQNCLDTYRDWLHRRSACPVCDMHVMQRDAQHYHCHNCQTLWQVSSARFLRPYRKTVRKIKPA